MNNNVQYYKAILVCFCFLWVSYYHASNPILGKTSQIGFIENKGQIVDQNHNYNSLVKYLLISPGINVQLRSNGFSYDVYKTIDNNPKKEKGHKHDHNNEDSGEKDFSLIKTYFHRIDIDFIGSNKNPLLLAEGLIQEKINFYTSFEEHARLVQANKCKKVVYKDLYNGIDLEMVALPKSGAPVKFNFIVKPGADPSVIKWRYNGSELPPEIVNRSIKMHFSFPEINQNTILDESIPASFEMETNNQIKITYKKQSSIFSFNFEKYDNEKTLVIDPTPQLTWGTYYGDVENDISYATKVDGNNDVYIAGQTSSLINIATLGAFQIAISGTSDGFIAKFDPAGNRLWATYIGGSGTEALHSVSFDLSNNVYTTGFTNSTNFPVSFGCHQAVSGGGIDLVVAKFSSAGALLWSTYYGGAGNDVTGVGGSFPSLSSCSVRNGFLHVCSGTTSNANISTPGTYKPSYSGTMDAYAVKFDLNGNRIWGTYFGGSQNEGGCDIDADNLGNVAIVGTTFSSGLFSSGYVSVYPGLRSGYAVVLNAAGTNTVWGTYLNGGSGFSNICSCEYDASNNLVFGGFVVGDYTFPTTLGCYKPTYFATCAAALGKFNPLGVPIWITLYGGCDEDHGYDVSLNSSGDIFISGETSSICDVATQCSHKDNLNPMVDLWDCFVAKFTSAGAFVWGTYYGGADSDKPYRLAADNSNYVYLTGSTGSPSQISTSGSFQPAFIGSGFKDDAFLAKFYDCKIADKPTIVATPTAVCLGNTTTLSIATGSLNNATHWQWYTGSCGGSAIGTGTSIVVSPTAATTYYVRGEGACTACECATISIGVNPNPTVTIAPLTPTICSGASSTMTAIGASSYTWSPLAVFSSTIMVSPLATAIYTVIGKDVNGCISVPVASTVYVNPTPTISVNSGTICSGQSFTLNPIGAITYTYAGGSHIVSPLSSSTYSVIGENAFGCVSLPVTSTITVTPNPTITVNNGTICSGSSFTIIPGGAMSYTYEGGSSVVKPTTSRTYTVIGEDAIGCVSLPVTSTITVYPTPTITLASGTICSGESFTLSPSGAISYTYSSGGPIVSPVTNTTYTVIGESIFGCISTQTAAVQISPKPSIVISGVNQICYGGNTTLVASGAITYSWSNGATTNTIYTSPSSTTNFTVYGSNIYGCVGTETIAVIVNLIPVLSVSGNSVLCSGESTTITLGGAASYSWSPGTDLNTVFGSSVICTPPHSTTYTVVAASANGCTTNIAIPISVIPSPTLSISATPTVICEGESAILSAFGASTYSWSPTFYLNSVSANPTTVNPTLTTTYTLQGFNNSPPNYCISTKTVQVKVVPKIIAKIEPVPPLCIGQSNNLKASGGNTYSWMPKTGLSKPTSSNTAVQTTVNTTYTVTVSQNGACPAQATVNIIVVPIPIIEAGQDTSVVIGESIVLKGKGNVTVGFIPIDGPALHCNYCNSLIVSPQNTTCYRLRGENSYGCVAYDDVCVRVIKDWDVYIPNTFTPSNDGINEFFIPIGYGIDYINLTIFDRWGNKLYREEKTEKGWDGRYQGKLCKQDVYVYLVEIKTMEGAMVRKTGQITILSPSN